jgi:exopolyphosphatase / guanosine-5'-triphosphate,3'-diphosphate pyrophosphatase
MPHTRDHAAHVLRVACIDIGTNTTRLLVAERAGRGMREIAAERRFTPLGAGRTGFEAIGAERSEAVARGVAEQAHRAREAGAEPIRAVATAAIRDAPDRAALLGAVRAASGLEVAILAGDEEARLAFLGAVRTLAREPAGVVAVVDVGGGSTEVAVGTASEGATWSRSAPVGSRMLADAYLHTDPPTEEHLRRVRDAADGALALLPDPPAAITAAFAVGGSANSLRRLAGSRVDADVVADALRALCDAGSAEVAARMGLDARRVRLLPAALLLLGAASTRLGHPLELTRGGLREGVAIELLSSVHEGSPDPE